MWIFIFLAQLIPTTRRLSVLLCSDHVGKYILPLKKWFLKSFNFALNLFIAARGRKSDLLYLVV